MPAFCHAVMPLPESWSNPTVFRNLRYLSLANNWFWAPLPEKWANPNAFPKVRKQSGQLG